MEDLKIMTKDFKSYDLERNLLKEYVKASKNEDFSKTVSRLGLTEEIAMKYTSKLERTTEELNNCSKCKCLEECKNSVRGCVYYPKQNDDRLSFDYVTCKYMKEYLEKSKYKSEVFEEPRAIEMARMADIDLTDKNRAKVIKWVKDFYKEYQTNKNIKGCYLHGSFGSGKSFIIAALLNELALKKSKSVIMYYPEMLRKLKESFYDDFDVKMDLIKKCDLLLIDDIGAEAVSTWSRDEILGTILQYRMDASLPTFFTSNLSIEELEGHLAQTKTGVDIVKAKRIIERIKQLTVDLELISENRRK